MRLLTGLLLIAGYFYACSGHPEQDTTAYRTEKAPVFPVPNYPEDNQPDSAKIELGRLLFFDPILSSDSSVSCASCHLPDFAFADTVAFSRGVDGKKGKRNAPSLINVAYKSHFFKDGGAPSLEIQMLTPLQDENEMNLPVTMALERLNEHPFYTRLFQAVFGKRPDLFGLTRAIAAYQRSLIGGHSRFDRYLSTNDSTLLTPDEWLGWQLFSGDQLNCVSCHPAPFFTDNSFRNNGLYAIYEDIGRANITLDSADIGKFNVPSLRNVDLTAPYMHNGSLPTLQSVIRHYAGGGHAHANKDSDLQAFELTPQEEKALVAFLKSLTDTTINLEY